MVPTTRQGVNRRCRCRVLAALPPIADHVPMPRTLYRHILGELLKLMLTTTAVLVVVLGFFFAIKPISDGLLSPASLIKVVVYAIPGMLPFALPFAAALASTLVFYRMSSDNEITAAAAGGISYRSLLMPVLGLGLAIGLLTLFLSNWVVPRFWQLVEKEMEKDVVKLVVRQIQRGEVIEWGDMVLYADAAEERVAEAPADGGRAPDARLVMEGVAVGKMQIREEKDADGNVRHTQVMGAEYTARQAVVDLYRDEEQGRLFATMMLADVVIDDPSSGTLVAVERQPINAREVPIPLQQKPKFMSLPRLQQLSREPERSPEVRGYMQSLRRAMAERAVREQVVQKLLAGEALSLVGSRGNLMTLRAPRVEPSGGRVMLMADRGDRVVVRARRDGRLQDLIAERGELEVERSELDDEPRLTLTLEAVTVVDPALPTPSRLNKLSLPLLRSQQPFAADLAGMKLAELTEAAKPFATDPEIDDLSRILASVIRNLHREITSHLHERSASALQCAWSFCLAQ